MLYLRFYGPRAKHPMGFIQKNWAEEPFTGVRRVRGGAEEPFTGVRRVKGSNGVRGYVA